MKHLLLLLFCALVFGCSQKSAKIENALLTNSNRSVSSQSNTTQPNAERQAAISPEGKIFESLTADSNYFDAVKLLGTPDAETDLPKLKLPTPTILTFYKQNAYLLFINKDKPEEKSVKSNYKYIGTIKAQPPEILHSAKPEYVDLLEFFRAKVVKTIAEQAQKETKSQKGK